MIPSSGKKLLAIFVAGSALGLLLSVRPIGGIYKKTIVPSLNQNDSTRLNTDPAPANRPEETRYGLPVRLRIPAIKVDAAIELVGLTTAGAMDVPQRPNDVAWFNLGPRPGEAGSAVIAGHRDWYNGQAAVFMNLGKLRAGDQLSIEDDQGQSTTFIVRHSRLYAYQAEAPEVFTSVGGKQLNLLTCTGVWNKHKKSYNQRLVVFTDLMPKLLL